MPKVGNVAEAIVKAAERDAAASGKKGKVKDRRSVRVRAIAVGYYGYPVASTKLAGTEFNFRVHDLTVFPNGKPRPDKDELQKSNPTLTHYDGTDIKFITIDKKQYPLPKWCEDASQPSSLIEEEDEGDGTFPLADADEM